MSVNDAVDGSTAGIAMCHGGFQPPIGEPPNMEVTTIGLDLAKNVFQVHGVDDEGTVVIRRQLRRSRVLPFFKKLPPCLIGIEACATAQRPLPARKQTLETLNCETRRSMSAYRSEADIEDEVARRLLMTHFGH